MDELGHDTDKKAHNDCPDKMHCPSPFPAEAQWQESRDLPSS
jgi:hypothetical protein